MSEEARDTLVADWLLFQRTPESSPEYETRRRIVSQIDKLCQEHPDQAWQFILHVLAQVRDEELLGVLAAGPLEDLLGYHGSDLIERVESIAARNDRFRGLLHMLYQSVPDHLWVRIQRAASQPDRRLTSR